MAEYSSSSKSDNISLLYIEHTTLQAVANSDCESATGLSYFDSKSNDAQ